MLPLLLMPAFLLAVPVRNADGPPVIETKLHGEWKGGACQGTLILRPNGRFERSGYTPGNNKLSGTWKVRWDALPPTLVLKCDASDFDDNVGKSEEFVILQLDEKTLGYQYPEWKNRGPILWERVTVEKLVRESDLVVVGQLTITATRDGHVGTIEVAEVLLGQVKEKTIRFDSPPIELPQGQLRIWFLEDGHLENAGLPTSERATVVKEIAKQKK
jgi:hypothetical protein